MNKILIAALLVVMSGTAFGTLHAQQVGASKLSSQQIKSLPAPVQETIRQLQAGKVKDAPPSTVITDYIAANTPKINALQSQLNALLQKKGYLIGTPVTVILQDYIASAKNSIKALTQVENSPSAISNVEGAGPGLIQALDNMAVPTAFPGKCYDYAGEKVTGIIETRYGKMHFYYPPYGDKDFYEFLTPEQDIGLIGSGKENYPKISAPKTVTGLLSPDKKIVCLGL